MCKLKARYGSLVHFRLAFNPATQKGFVLYVSSASVNLSQQ